jgi:hypothetical protein
MLATYDRAARLQLESALIFYSIRPAVDEV